MSTLTINDLGTTIEVLVGDGSAIISSEINNSGEDITIDVTDTQEVVTLDLAVNGADGAPGPMGPQGPAGEGDLSFTYDQGMPSILWTINHDLGKRPSVSAVDSAETAVVGLVEYIDDNNLTIKFNAAFTGQAYLN